MGGDGVKLADELVNEIFVGCPLIGNTTSRGIVNGVFYEVRGFTETHVHLADLESVAERDTIHRGEGADLA